ncbi:uncharacterized protein LOC142163716 [Nicotiana tabacum]|uniref:Uncharacterized protein LOC142163716 n=1 Tax=Nicotiana tabacum TaxID=4097 RepID=A0AC58RW78_TOBAC
METIKAIIKELNGDCFALLVDESFDVSRKEQMAIVLRYVDRMRFVVERLIDIVHVKDTCASSLKEAIVDLLAKHSLSLSYVRGQYYDGANNMQGELIGLKMLIKQESRSAHSIHCFAHQLQLSLLTQRIEEALDMSELKTGRGLNQELGLSRAFDTRWGSHYKSFKNFILMFGSILHVLEALVVDARLMDERAKAMGYLRACQTFEVAFMLHLMTDVLAITNELNEFLQKKEQDITNAMLLIEVAKRRLQKFNGRFDEVTTNLLHGVACLNPIDSFSSFDIKKIMKMAKLYPDDFDEVSMGALENQLATSITDVRDIDERFSNLNGFCDLSRKLVETKKHLNFPLVFCLVKFALLLPVATASVERAFSAMKFIKNGMQNRMNDELLSGCLVPYVEKDVFSTISNDRYCKNISRNKTPSSMLVIM